MQLRSWVHTEPSAPSVHTPVLEPAASAQRVEMQSPASTHELLTSPVVQLPWS